MGAPHCRLPPGVKACLCSSLLASLEVPLLPLAVLHYPTLGLGVRRYNSVAEEVERLRDELAAKEVEMREARQAEQEFAAEIERQEQLFSKERQQLKVGGAVYRAQHLRRVGLGPLLQRLQEAFWRRHNLNRIGWHQMQGPPYLVLCCGSLAGLLNCSVQTSVHPSGSVPLYSCIASVCAPAG